MEAYAAQYTVTSFQIAIARFLILMMCLMSASLIGFNRQLHSVRAMPNSLYNTTGRIQL